MKFSSLIKSNKTLTIILLITILFFLFAFFIAKKQTIFADGAGYFSYPYELLKNGNLEYSSSSSSKYFGVIKTPEYNLNKYPIGTGLFLTPAFLAGDLVNSLSTRFDHSIFSKNYQFFVGFFGILYLIAGLVFLQKVLRSLFSKKASDLTLLAIALATNLTIYATVDASFSHIYSFLTINAFIYFVLKCIKNFNYKNSALLGLSLGLVLLIRPSNAIVVLIPIIVVIPKLKKTSIFQFQNIKKIISILFFTLLTIFPQISYWQSITGNPIIFSYRGEHFNFLSPQIANVLFSFNRGLLTLSPILILSILGLNFLRKKYLGLCIAVFVFMIFNLIIISSWWMWDYGIGYGHRAFTDSLGIAALPMAALLENLTKSKYKFFLFAYIIICIITNFVFMIQYIYR